MVRRVRQHRAQLAVEIGLPLPHPEVRSLTLIILLPAIAADRCGNKTAARGSSSRGTSCTFSGRRSCKVWKSPQRMPAGRIDEHMQGVLCNFIYDCM